MVSDVTDRKALETAVRKRKKQAFRPGTTRNQKAIYALFSFLPALYPTDVNPSAYTLCLYVEFLARTFVSPQTIKKYISVIRLMHKYIGLNIPDSLNSFELGLMLRALDITSMHQPAQKQPLTLNMLKDICYLCDSIGNTGRVYKFAFLLSFYEFLRQSNLAPKRFWHKTPHMSRWRHSAPPRANSCIEMDKNATNRRIQPGYTPACYTKEPFVPSGRFQSHVASITHYFSQWPPPLVAGSFKKHSDRRQTENSFPSPY